MNWNAVLVMFALNAPANPLSPLITTSSTRFSGRVANSGCRRLPVSSSKISTRRVSDSSTLVIIFAYGRAASARSCARRSFAAETIFMALVICRVFFTLRMRRRRSSTFAINQFSVHSRQLQLVSSVI